MDPKTVYAWDSMDDQDKQSSITDLQETENWVVWKTRDKTWTHTLRREGSHQLLSFNKDEKENISGFKIKGWWRRGDIKVTNLKSTFECWVKSPSEAPGKAQESIKTTLTAPKQNYGKDNYIVDLDNHERAYCLGTESGLLGTFHFDGTCTDGDGSCDVASYSMGVVFCNLTTLGWLTGQHLAPLPLRGQRDLHSYRVGREEEGMSSNRPELVALRECLETHQDHENVTRWGCSQNCHHKSAEKSQGRCSNPANQGQSS